MIAEQYGEEFDFTNGGDKIHSSSWLIKKL